jgi:pimeloyl-ACP methyl ester carboxylesterase
VLPERALARNGCAALRRILARGAAAPLPPALEDAYVALYCRPGGGGFTSPLNYYRAAGRGLWPTSLRRIEVPVLVLWGEQDAYLMASMAEPPAALAPRARVLRFPTATHWVHWDEAAAVNAALLDLLAQPAVPV